MSAEQLLYLDGLNLHLPREFIAFYNSSGFPEIKNEDFPLSRS